MTEYENRVVAAEKKRDEALEKVFINFLIPVVDVCMISKHCKTIIVLLFNTENTEKFCKIFVSLYMQEMLYLV